VFAQQDYNWNEIDIVIENKYSNRIYVGPGYFRLYLSSLPTNENAQMTGCVLKGWTNIGDRSGGKLGGTSSVLNQAV